MKKEKRNEKPPRLSRRSTIPSYPVAVTCRPLPPPIPAAETAPSLEIYLEAFEIGCLAMALLHDLQDGTAKDQDFRLVTGTRYRMTADEKTGAVTITPLHKGQ